MSHVLEQHKNRNSQPAQAQGDLQRSTSSAWHIGLAVYIFGGLLVRYDTKRPMTCSSRIVSNSLHDRCARIPPKLKRRQSTCSEVRYCSVRSRAHSLDAELPDVEAMTARINARPSISSELARGDDGFYQVECDFADPAIAAEYLISSTYSKATKRRPRQSESESHPVRVLPQFATFGQTERGR